MVGHITVASCKVFAAPDGRIEGVRGRIGLACSMGIEALEWTLRPSPHFVHLRLLARQFSLRRSNILNYKTKPLNNTEIENQPTS
jgi:hypothetical protein